MAKKPFFITPLLSQNARLVMLVIRHKPRICRYPVPPPHRTRCKHCTWSQTALQAQRRSSCSCATSTLLFGTLHCRSRLLSEPCCQRRVKGGGSGGGNRDGTATRHVSRADTHKNSCSMSFFYPDSPSAARKSAISLTAGSTSSGHCSVSSKTRPVKG